MCVYTSMHAKIDVYVYMHICIHIWRQTCMGIYVFLYVHNYTYYTHRHVVMDVCMYVHMYGYVFMLHGCIDFIVFLSILTWVCMYAYMSVCIYPYMYVCRQTCIYVCTYICILHTCILTHHHHHQQGFLLHSCWRNPSLLIVQQCRSLATWLQFGPIASSRLSCQHLYGWPLGHLWSHGHHSVTCLVHLLSFSHATCPTHQYLMVQIWWITSMTPVFEQIQLALFLSGSVSPIIIHSILCCFVTIFCSCVLLRDHVSLPYVITGSMHSLCTFVFNLSGIPLFHIMKSSLLKAVQPRPILCLNSCSWSWSFITIWLR